MNRGSHSEEVVIAAQSVEAIASRVVALLHALNQHGSREWVDARELARLLGLSRNTVYAKADELGGIRLGTGTRARLRFDVGEATEALRSRERPASRTSRKLGGRRQGRSSGIDLLPIRGERPPSRARRRCSCTQATRTASR
jgi:hypothetical protein